MKQTAEPFRLENNRMSYLIPGGELIDKFLGTKHIDPMASQMWIASAVTTAIKGEKNGISRIREEDGGGEFSSVLKENGDELLGRDFVEKHGSTPGFLLKLLNSSDRLLVQVHPDKEKAKKYFGLPFGKTESWYVLDVEEREKAYIWAGFKENVTPEGFLKLIEKQDTQAILEQLHRFEIRPGDVILIPAGLVHALGNHSLVAEIQEPVDLTLRAERIRPDGSWLSEESLHSGIGLKGLIDCFHFDCNNYETTRQRIFITPTEVREEGNIIRQLIGEKQTACFGMERLWIGKRLSRRNRRFAVGLVLEGAGRLCWEGKSIEIQKGTEFFIPAGLKQYEYETNEKDPLSVLECYPPE